MPDIPQQAITAAVAAYAREAYVDGEPIEGDERVVQAALEAAAPFLARVSDGTMPCPVPSPQGLPCVKRIPEGWTADEGHGGGHFWISPEIEQALERGHYDARAALAGQPFRIHQPEDCTPSCPHWQAPA